ncbi:MAG: hypothetical protein KAY32_10455 [Candidatus Eisenbacteria sp.]|nr:hypothetical protein [Candidatus Eisenbacteria bacterium]
MASNARTNVPVCSLLAGLLLSTTFAAYAVDPAGGFGGGPISGTLSVVVVDEWTGASLEEAFVQVGLAPALPFPGNYGWTDSAGAISFADVALSGPQTVTVGKMDYSFSTIFEVDAATVILPIRPRTAPISRPTYTGDISGFDVVWNDGQFDAAVVWHTLPIRDILPMIEDLTSGRTGRLSPQVVESFPLIGDHDLPGAIYFPFQIELLLYPVERTPYVIYVEDETTTDLWAIYGRIPVLTVLAELIKPFPDLFNLILAFDIRRYGLEEGVVVDGSGTRDFTLTIERGAEVYIPIADTEPGLNVLAAGVADLDGLSGAGRLFPSGFTAVPGDSSTILGVPTLGTGIPGTPDYIFGVVQTDTTEVLGTSAVLARAGLAPGDTAAPFSFLEFTSLTVSETLFAWTSMAKPAAGLFPHAHEATISWVRSEPDTNSWAEPGDSLEVSEQLWAFHLNGETTEFSLPLLAMAAPDPLLDPDTTSALDWLEGEVTGFLMGAAPSAFDYDEWDLADRSAHGTHFCSNMVDSIPPPISPAASVEDGEGAAGRVPRLSPPHPNPFRAETAARFLLPAAREAASLIVYDITGRRLRDLSTQLAAGRNAVVWDGLNDTGRPVPSGIYLIRLETDVEMVTRTVVRIR